MRDSILKFATDEVAARVRGLDRSRLRTFSCGSLRNDSFLDLRAVSCKRVLGGAANPERRSPWIALLVHRLRSAMSCQNCAHNRAGGTHHDHGEEWLNQRQPERPQIRRSVLREVVAGGHEESQRGARDSTSARREGAAP